MQPVGDAGRFEALALQVVLVMFRPALASPSLLTVVAGPDSTSPLSLIAWRAPSSWACGVRKPGQAYAAALYS